MHVYMKITLRTELSFSFLIPYEDVHIHFIVSLTQPICVFHCYNMYSDGTLNPSGVQSGTAELYDISEC